MEAEQALSHLDGRRCRLETDSEVPQEQATAILVESGLCDGAA